MTTAYTATIQTYPTKAEAVEFAISMYGSGAVASQVARVVKIGPTIARSLGVAEGYAVDALGC